MNRSRMSRRTLLRGTGTAIALPLLEAMSPRRAHAAPPVRLVTWFWPNGTRASKWAPTATGSITASNLNACNKVFGPEGGKRDLVPYLTFVSGIGSRLWRSGHSCAMMAAGDGGTDEHNNQGNWPTTATIDQICAERLGQGTRVPSLVMNATHGGGTPGGAYLSWKDGSRPVLPHRAPLPVFALLFGAGAGAPATDTAAIERLAKRRKSVLDFVKADAQRVGARLGAADRARVDEHLQTLRELEKQIFATAQPGSAGVASCGAPAQTGFDGRLANGYASDREPLLLRLVALAYKCDLTRYASFMLDHAGGQKQYPGARAHGDHDMSHNGSDDDVVTVTNVKLGYLAAFLRELADTPEGDRTLLDNVIVYSTSDVDDGQKHGRSRLPTLLAGRAGGALKGGRHLTYSGPTLNDVMASVLTYAGVPTGKLGPAGTGPLPGL
jgi:hypothetical protein